MRTRAGLALLIVAICAVAVGLLADRREEAAPTAVVADPASAGRATATATVQTRPRAHAETPPPTARTVARGGVFTRDGEPLADDLTIVELRPFDPVQWKLDGRFVPDFARLLATGRTHRDGTYELTTDESQCVVIARREGYVPTVEFLSEEGVADIRMVSGTQCDLVVVDRGGRPIGTAEAWVVAHDVVRSTCSVGTGGEVRVVVGPNDSVLVRALGFADEYVAIPEERAEQRPVRVVLRPALEVSGMVVDDAGAPFAGARVSLAHDAIRTGANGRFTFDRLDPEVGDALWLQVSAPGWCGGEHIDVWPGEPPRRVVLRRSGIVRGVVVHEDGTPAIAGVSGGPVTDSDGHFELIDFQSGRQLIWADARLPADERVFLHGSEWVDVPPGGIVEGVRITVAPDPLSSFAIVRVVDPEQRPVKGVEVTAWHEDEKISSWKTAADGTAVLHVRRPTGSQLVLAASHGGLDARNEGIVTTLMPPQECVEMRLGAKGRLKLRVLDAAGNEVPRRKLTIGGDTNRLLPREDGDFDLPATIDWVATISTEGSAKHEVVLQAPHPAVREETIRLQPACSVVGRIVGAPENARVEVIIRYGPKDAWEYAESELGTAGRFRIDAIPPGHGFLRVLGENDAVLDYREMEIRPGRVEEAGEIQLSGQSVLRGVVVDTSGRPVGGAHVVFRDPGDREACPSTCTRPDGAFESVVAGSFPVAVRVSRSGFGTRLVTMTPDGDGREQIVLGPPGRVRLRGTFLNRPGGVHWPEVRLPGSWVSWQPDGSEGGADEEGEVYGDLPEGPLEVIVRSGRDERVRRIEVAAGKTTDCEFSQ